MPALACGPFLLALLLGGCSESSRPSSAEEEQLDNAAELLDSAPDALSDIDDNEVGSAETNTAD